MTFREFFQRNVAFAILLIATISPATALATALTDKNVPLKVSLELQEQVGFRPDCPYQFGGTTDGTGKSTHLGKVSFQGTDCIMPIENYFAFEGEFILAAADSDRLMGNYSGLFIPIDAGPTYRITDATMEITGGTGRFAGATGSIELTGTEDMTTGDGLVEAEGTMSKSGWAMFNEEPLRVTGMAFQTPSFVNEYVDTFRNFAIVDPSGETFDQPTQLSGLVSASNVTLLPEPTVLLLLGTGLAALRFAQYKKKC